MMNVCSVPGSLTVSLVSVTTPSDFPKGVTMAWHPEVWLLKPIMSSALAIPQPVLVLEGMVLTNRPIHLNHAPPPRPPGGVLMEFSCRFEYRQQPFAGQHGSYFGRKSSASQEFQSTRVALRPQVYCRSVYSPCCDASKRDLNEPRPNISKSHCRDAHFVIVNATWHEFLVQFRNSIPLVA